MEKRVKEIILPSAVYVALLTIILWFLVLQETTIPFNFLGYSLELSLSFLGPPLIALLSMRYLSLVVEKLLTGDATQPLSEGLDTIAVTSFLYFAADWSLVPGWVKPITAFLFYSSILSTLHKTISVFIRDINYIFEPLLTSLYILFIGFIGSHTWLSVYPHLEGLALSSPYSDLLSPYFEAGLARPVNNVIVASTAITAVLSLTGIVKNHPNPYLRYVGTNVGSQMEKVTLVNFVLIYYLFFVRTYLIGLSGLNPQYIVIAEWAAICLGFYLGYRSIKSYAEASLVQQDLTGTWRRHLQQVNIHTDSQLDHLSGLVERFIVEGEKNEFIVQLSLLLRNSGGNAYSITSALTPLIEYRDMNPPKIGLPWQADNIAKLNHQRRRKIVNTVLGSIQLKPPGIQPTPEEAEEASQEVY
ncbi:hypothetical protein JXL21_12985 [Candidatus Bathyarchaeota archaeon]|nr:hypothetical protein [Candidatus Bathyarchaeota archaeon]